MAILDASLTFLRRQTRMAASLGAVVTRLRQVSQMWQRREDDAPPEVLRARQLIAAVDKGGLPLNPAIVNQIARALGLEVTSRAPIEQTVERIRQALARI